MNNLIHRLPNAITVARGLAGPIGAFMLLESRFVAVTLENTSLSNGYAIASGLIFLIAVLSDWLDGWLARRLGHESELGALLDPIADKVLIGSYLVAYVVITNIDLYLAVPVAIIIARDLTITGLRLNSEMPELLAVSMTAKLKTALQMVVTAAPFVLIVAGFQDVSVWYFYWAGCIWALAVITVWTALPYLKAVRNSRNR